MVSVPGAGGAWNDLSSTALKKGSVPEGPVYREMRAISASTSAWALPPRARPASRMRAARETCGFVLEAPGALSLRT